MFTFSVDNAAFFISALFLIPLLATSLFNFLTLSTLSPVDDDQFSSLLSLSHEVSGNDKRTMRATVIIPMRNEEANVKKLLTPLVAIADQWRSAGNTLEIICINDQSTDRTGEFLAEFLPTITIIQGSDLPKGWRGKNWANFQAADLISNRSILETPQFLFFIDADISWQDDPFTASIHHMMTNNYSYLSPYPQELALSWAEKISQPLLAWSWMSTLPIRPFNHSLRPSTVVANGQFLAIESVAYFAIDGHRSIASSVLDDMDIARELRRYGFHGTVINGASMISCRMYSNSSEIFAGYTKSLWYALGSLPLSLFTAIWLFFTGIFPVIELFISPHKALILLGALLISRYLAAVKSRSSLTSPWLHPISATMLIGGIIASRILHKRGRLQWKGRSI